MIDVTFEVCFFFLFFFFVFTRILKTSIKTPKIPSNKFKHTNLDQFWSAAPVGRPDGQADPTQKQTVDLHETEKSCLGMSLGLGPQGLGIGNIANIYH